MINSDSFSERIVTKKKSATDKLMILGVFAIGFGAIYTILMNMEKVVNFFIFLIAAVLFAMYHALNQFNIEYEYAITNGEIDIDKIISRSRRKRIISVDSRDFEYFAPLNSETKNVYNANDYAKKIDVFSSPDAKGIYFAYFIKNGQKTRLAFQPSEKMIEDIKMRMPRSMFFA